MKAPDKSLTLAEFTKCMSLYETTTGNYWITLADVPAQT